MAAQKARRSNYAEPAPWLAVALARLGRAEEGRALLAQHAAKTPGFSVLDCDAQIKQIGNKRAAPGVASLVAQMRPTQL
jgi:hypothetical protein